MCLWMLWIRFAKRNWIRGGSNINKRQTGTEYETLAVAYLEKQDVRIVERNFRNRFGEIDIIGYDGEYLVFFEVKYRRDERKGRPIEAVSPKKCHTICRVADYYRMKNGIGDFSPMRFDVIAICGDEIEWFRNAFAYC